MIRPQPLPPAAVLSAFADYAAETSPPARRVKLDAFAKACQASGLPLQEAVDRIRHAAK